MFRRLALLVPVAALASFALPQPLMQTGAPAGGLVTLRVADDRSSSFDFDKGEPATRLVGGELNLDEAEIVFDRLAPSQLSIGFRRDESVRLVDIGDFRINSVRNARDIAPKPSASVYESLTLDGKRFRYRAPVNRVLRLEAAERVFSNFPAEGAQHFEPQLGHVYVMRWAGPSGDRVERVVKFQVVELVPDQSVTLRWARL